MSPLQNGNKQIMITSIALPIIESSQAGEARRIAQALASRLGFNETERGKVGIVVSEVATNLVKHATQGQLILQALEKNQIRGIEILALDKGPGISNLGECLRDGFSTAGSAGTGLGACQRLSALFEIYSLPNVGTALLSQLWATPQQKKPQANTLEVGVVCLPQTGEEVCGDAWAIEQDPGRSMLLVADGLGHGPLAAQASLEAVRILRENISNSPKQITEAAHSVLRRTRGAAMAIAEIDFEQQIIRFAGVGNIAATIISAEQTQSLVSHNGTVGHELRKIQEFVYPWQKEKLLVMSSDGLGTHWRLSKYPGLATKHPSLIAGVLYRDFNRGRDDVTVFVARES